MSDEVTNPAATVEDIPPIIPDSVVDTENDAINTASDSVDSALVPTVETPNATRPAARRKRRGRGRDKKKRREKTQTATETATETVVETKAEADGDGDEITAILNQEFYRDSLEMLFSILAIFLGRHWELSGKESGLVARTLDKFLSKWVPQLSRNRSFSFVFAALALFIFLPRVWQTIKLRRSQKNANTEYRQDGDGQKLSIAAAVGTDRKTA